ncbi:hypothetical protein DEJ51_01150 [Streptomyces venezuelae]|uniref:Uncharacterized protein n=2 Tax=Streptomyces venezuelae TaxID=54571 RepID=A0A5P2DFY6_STRVZ|nr:hypothetical protein DEJ51_01150 [Streptomyces venezuelae]
MGRRREAELDRDVAAFLAARAFTEIRHVAGGLTVRDTSPEEVLDRIRFLADLSHNLPGVARPRPRTPSRLGKPLGSFDQAMAERPLSWVWSTAGPEARAWMLRHIEQMTHHWTPPPPLPRSRTGPAPVTLRRQTGILLGRWPVRTPAGRRPLPAQARVLKALDTEGVCALNDEAHRLRLGLGGSGSWLRAHLAPDGVHYLLPDPADYYWPGNPDSSGGGIRWWQCTMLLRMRDGEQVASMVAVLPGTFAALPSTVPRRRQLRLAHVVRSVERDTSQWGRDHESACGPGLCGYVREAAGDAPTAT